MKELPKVFVIQQGARHRYAIPRMLNARGCLSGLFTDSHAGSIAGKLACMLSKFNGAPQGIIRLTKRTISGIPDHLIRSTDRWLLKKKHLAALAGRNTAVWLDCRDNEWFKLAKNSFPKGAEILYAMGGENLRLLSLAKESGLRIIIDAFINPVNLRQTGIAKKFAGLPLMLDEAECSSVEAHYRKVFDLTDIILCPSQWVADGVMELVPEHSHKIRICPYGSSLPPSAVPRAPVAGRIFWAGGDWFRKGLHHLAAAADIALREFPEMEFRIAGITDPAVIAMPQFRNLRFLGKLDRAGMQEEFSKADLFVFPTLTEGMASVMVEAVSAGCPVLATPGAGFDGLEESGAGRIFDAEDHAALANLMLDLTRERAILQTMNEACVRFAPGFTEEAWAKRLIPILQELAGSSP